MVKKYNKWYTKQERTLLLTNMHLFNIKKGTQVQRRIAVTDVKCVTKSLKNNEFIIHIKKQYDYHFETEHREEMIGALKWVFWQTHAKNIPVYGVNEAKIDSLATTKKKLANGEIVA